MPNTTKHQLPLVPPNAIIKKHLLDKSLWAALASPGVDFTDIA